MSTYYEYREVGVMIAHRLMAMEGWKVYGYTPDKSDAMVDYWSPAHWDGIAEKNGYVFCFNTSREEKAREIRTRVGDNNKGDSTSTSASILKKIQKLETMTVSRGASESEEKTAKEMIDKLRQKSVEKAETENEYIVTGMFPGHLANPPRCNWHIEKDGIIVAKGTGMLKFAHIGGYYKYDKEIESLRKFRTMTEKEFKEDYISDIMMYRWHSTREEAAKRADSYYLELKENVALVDKFDEFIAKIDSTCGGLLGSGDRVTYEKKIVTEYKKEIKAFETENGCLKDGQCFILKSFFNYGRSKGLVYRIHETDYNGKKHFTAYKLNGKLTKECHGMANRENSWYISSPESLTKWIEKGDISWCELKEVKTPYQVEKVVKKVVKAKKETSRETSSKEGAKEASLDASTLNAAIKNLNFEIKEDVDTRTGERIYLAKIQEKLSREDYIQVNKYIKSLGGYYSKFKHAFLFKENPADLLTA